MATGSNGAPWRVVKLNSPFHTGMLACVVAALSYLAARRGGMLVMRPQGAVAALAR